MDQVNFTNNPSSESAAVSSSQENDVARLILRDEGDLAYDSMPLPRDVSRIPSVQFHVTNSSNTIKKKFMIIIAVILSIFVMALIIGISTRNHAVEDESCTSKLSNTISQCDKWFPWQHFRLPERIRPEHYSITLYPNMTQMFFTGTVGIVVNVIQSTNLIVLHSHGLKLNSVRVTKYEYINQTKTQPDTGIYQGNGSEICESFDFVAITLPQLLVVGVKYYINISYSANFTESLNGFYISKYQDNSGGNHTLATTQFETIYARAAFPCFDEPSYKATFKIHIVREKEYTALSNMPVESTSNEDGGNLLMDTFQTTVPMSTYLVAFIISDFESITKTIQLKRGNVSVSVYAAKDKITNANFALDVACKVLSVYENVFKIAYPLPKLDLVAIPDFEAGAMENWGLVTYRETVILWDEKTSSKSDQELIALVIAHELAHQWFGNLVTMKWWNDLWLNEGFASYMEFFGVDKLFPSWKFIQGFNEAHTSGAMETDQSKYTHPISVPVNSVVEIEELFDDISYSKGACIISMMVGYLGEGAFFRGLEDYLIKFAFNNTVNRDLIHAVAAKAETGILRDNVIGMFDSWTTQPGFPILNVSLINNQILLSQTRYLLSVNKTDIDYNLYCTESPAKKSIWEIPLSYKTDLSNKTEWEFITSEKYEFSVPSDLNWILFNVNRRGYYVINYDSNLFIGLSAQLNEDLNVIPPIDRSGILFNAEKSARAGFLGYNMLFDMLKYVKKEKEYGPIETASNIFYSIGKILKMQSYLTDQYKKFSKLTEQLLGKLYQENGWTYNITLHKNLTHPQIKLRKRLVHIMCDFDNDHCTKQAMQRFKDWKENEVSVLPNYKTIVYNTAIRLGSTEDWSFIWSKYTNDLKIDESEKRKMLRALCHTRNETKISFVLDEAIKGDNIRHQDISLVIVYLTNNRIGSTVAWKFIQRKWDKLTQIFRLGSFSMQRIIKGIFDTFMTSAQISSAVKFFEKKNITHIRFIQRAIDQARLNVHWIDNYQSQVIEWLNKNTI